MSGDGETYTTRPTDQNDPSGWMRYKSIDVLRVGKLWTDVWSILMWVAWPNPRKAFCPETRRKQLGIARAANIMSEMVLHIHGKVLCMFTFYWSLVDINDSLETCKMIS